MLLAAQRREHQAPRRIAIENVDAAYRELRNRSGRRSHAAQQILKSPSDRSAPCVWQDVAKPDDLVRHNRDDLRQSAFQMLST
jgi:hypothetical protein